MKSLPSGNLENEKPVADNARKFIVTYFDQSLLATDSVTSFTLTTNWLKLGENDETKIVHKDFHNGKVQTLLIEKVTDNGNRTTLKSEITAREYAEKRSDSLVEVVKERYEFAVEQNGIAFSMKYDEFVGPSGLCVLEVDAVNEETRSCFDPYAFSQGLREVSGDRGYEGYRVAGKI